MRSILIQSVASHHMHVGRDTIRDDDYDRQRIAFANSRCIISKPRQNCVDRHSKFNRNRRDHPPSPVGSPIASEDWFASTEIILEFCGALVFGWIFLVHSLTSDRPFVDPRLLLERNSVLGIGIATVFGMLFVTPMVMIPAMIQQLRDVPEFTSGLLIASRSLGTMLAQVLMIAFAHRWDPRPLFLIGFGAHTIAGLLMIQFDMNAPLADLTWLMIMQGFGVGCLWVPMTLVTFSNFDPSRSAEGMAIFHFMRSIGSSYYISASFIVVFHTQKITYSDLVHWVNPLDERWRLAELPPAWDINSMTGLASMAGEVTRQATAIGYINSFQLFLWTSLLAYPLIALIIWPPKGHRTHD